MVVCTILTIYLPYNCSYTLIFMIASILYTNFYLYIIFFTILKNISIAIILQQAAYLYIDSGYAK